MKITYKYSCIGLCTLLLGLLLQPISANASTTEDPIPGVESSIIFTTDGAFAFGCQPNSVIRPDASFRMDQRGYVAELMNAAASEDAFWGPGPCQRMGCSGRDQYCKSYVIFQIFGFTLTRHCTGEKSRNNTVWSR
ncbi:MAG: hypothetical protein O2991_02340 [Bacteroidetes bacterium]|nr:hypothetical protein [Bacteroidota bacterium]MDA0906900.1 hypothetical protein [Bacteroidota bacterium]